MNADLLRAELSDLAPCEAAADAALARAVEIALAGLDVVEAARIVDRNQSLHTGRELALHDALTRFATIAGCARPGGHLPAARCERIDALIAAGAREGEG